MPNLLTVSNLAVTLDGERVLENVSLELASGDSLAVIGPNGAGKSVFLRALLGMVPFDGTINWASNARIGYVPQKIDADRHLPITFENLLQAKAELSKLDEAAIEKVKTAVELNEKILKTPVGHLSGGQFQRGLIGYALLGDPSVIILDEPTASIDKSGEEQVYELIHRLQDKFGMTVILVSHDLSFVYRYATKVLCLNHSGICFGTPADALTPENLAKLYGGGTRLYHHIHPGADHIHEK